MKPAVISEAGFISNAPSPSTAGGAPVASATPAAIGAASPMDRYAICAFALP